MRVISRVIIRLGLGLYIWLGLWSELTSRKTSTLTLDPNRQNVIVEKILGNSLRARKKMLADMLSTHFHDANISTLVICLT